MQRWIPFLFLLFAPLAHTHQDPAPVKRAIEAWLAVQTMGLPGQVSYEISGLDPSNQLVPCQSFDVSRPNGGQSWGRTNVVVRCLGKAGWRVHVPVHIRIKREFLITARPIPQGQVVDAEDLVTQMGDISELPVNILVDATVVVGKVAATSIPAGRPLRADMLKAPLAVRQGQTVKVISRGPGFSVGNEGRALNNVQEGQVAQVRLATGQIINGIAKANGTVEVNY